MTMHDVPPPPPNPLALPEPWDLVAARLCCRRLGEAHWAERSERAAAHLVNELGPGPLELSTKAWLGVGRT
jgi:hypothetical protein